MFYSQYILARTGPLGKIWLAAHFEKKLTKSQVFSTDITESVKNIISPSIPLALRVSGHLMLGIVRIYSDKVKYLSTDCRDAMTKISLAFKAPTRLEVDQQPGGLSRIDDSNYAMLPVESEPSSIKPYPAERKLSGKYTTVAGRVDDSEMIDSFYTVGEIEYLRHEDLRPSLSGGRPSFAVPDSGRRRYETERNFEEELPAFDVQMGENLFAESRFDSLAQFGFEDSGAMPEMPALPEPDVSQFEFPTTAPVPTAQPARAKKRKVEISDKIEIPDALWKTRLKDVHAILRRAKDVEPLYRLVPAPEAALQVEEILANLSGASALCNELQEVVDVCTSGFDHILFPFERAAEYRAVREPSVTIPEVTRIAPSEEMREPELSMISGAEPRRGTLEPTMEVDYGDISGFEPQYGALESSFGMRGMEERKDENPLSRVVEQRLSGGKMEGPLEVTAGEQPQVEVRSERTNMVMTIIQQELDVKLSISLDQFCSGCSRSVAARFFLEALQLKTWNKIQLEQSGPFEPITITRP